MKSDNILLIDIGNTNLKWSLLQAGRLSPVTAKTHRGVTTDLLAIQCWADIPPPDKIILANVAGAELESGLISWMQVRWGRTPQVVRPVAQGWGVINGYLDPGQLGVDRWLTLLAVRRQECRAACIVDCGTAITVDLMDSGGRHHGGMILPGLDLMRESLLHQTRIPRVDNVSVDTLFARDTASAVASAAVNSAAALIERSMHQATAFCGEFPTLLLTGSDAERISMQLDISFQIDHELVMKGLVAIAETAAG
ncbi:type III pantothenate kinase [Sedimenticola sp.]|uniref:type III pantothenate kinase n=1 Tax=Sedimenticola sp. TaxID=1940285 RepID=UPI00258741F9|nr:type III pantothenate kinase [Sedimenticola sp.]MCW8903028.1 type III pantothenate kinase [Sedimenticola sp.]